MTPGPLSLIALAVTPVVLISASSILLNGVASKHSNMANRIRDMATEYRDLETTGDRRKSIEAQIGFMNRRITYIRRAHISLCAAIACFVLMVLVLTINQARQDWIFVTVQLFVGGVALLLHGVVSELIELGLAKRTLDIELSATFTKG